ncbi:Membrane protein involved in the export of O-antigen and teichoic acid [Mesonia phycicola]|uniref:Membrane protein involved in the export of O-antigen and teichoic acid n=1 Tax=Mesonia phycicola TaxID=579105 RepID=A0A1M6CY62_9FLAO|nr:polysaccharide biosynthesis C-terminal domain-containing protein [Mesonia phycicola]SHI66015.1 Membrane protein involved in the export of O-antigen and teichoic acid [Mesonia phycicola]
MGTLKRFFQDTFIYGLATVLPRLMYFLLIRLHTDTLENASYSDNTTFYIYAAFFNVLLTYGMETSFFRFFTHDKKNKSKIFSTALISLTVTTLVIFTLVLLFNKEIADFFKLNLVYFNFLLGVLALDTLVVVPFAYLRASGKPFKFSLIKLSNVFIYVLLNYFFLWAIPKYNIHFMESFKSEPVQYVFISNLAASAFTFILLLPYFFRTKLEFSTSILKKLLSYGWPIMVAGMAYVINENFDKWLLPQLLGKDVNGAYSACYKIAVFMTIFIQGFRLGAEPFFFSHAKEKNAKTTYAFVMKYFVILGSLMLLFVTVYLDWFKQMLVANSSYWVAISIVPVVLLANLFLGIYFNLSIWYKLIDKTRFGMYLSLIGALITIILNYLLIPIIGFMASAYTTLIAYSSMVVISYLLSRKYYAVPYDLSRILMYLILSTSFAFTSFYVFDNHKLIGTLLLFLFLGIIYVKEKKEIIQLLQS